MNTIQTQRFPGPAGGWLSTLAIALALFSVGDLSAASVRDIAPTADDAPVMLDADFDDFGNFAAFDGPANSRLIASIGNASEVIYFGLSAEVNEFGNAFANLGASRYRFQVRRLTDGVVVHGPFNVDNSSANVTNYADAEYGVYPTTRTTSAGVNVYRFAPGQAGEYAIEFQDIGRASETDRVLIPFWDFTVADASDNAIDGRVYSRSWTFRTPPVSPTDLPLCEWDREFNGQFYSYTEDGFVSLIDFSDAGFAGLTFTIAFNRTGPGSSGDLEADRQSAPGVDLTENAAEHRIFLSLPDETLFPSGECGGIDAAQSFRCNGPGEYCLDVTVTEPGQVEVILDFNGNGMIDDDMDRTLVFDFTADNLSACIPWDGLRGDGTEFEANELIDLIINYAQGVQHWAAYDVEFMRNGFCVETVRPVCQQDDQTLTSDVLYWDDRALDLEPGTGAPKDNRVGAECDDTPRAWNNFMLAPGQDCLDFEDDETIGYGDKSTLNTYWFANVTVDSRARVPLASVSISGETTICEAGSTTLTAVVAGNDIITTVSWSGPGIVDGTITESITVTESGEYCAAVVSESGCDDVICVDVTIGGANISLPDSVAVCLGDEITLGLQNLNPSDTLTYVWSPTELFEAGTATTANPTVIAGAGAYDVNVTVTSQAGCTSTESQNLFIIDPDDVLSFDPVADCSGLTVSFTNTSTVGFGYLWLFGDGGFSTDENPTYTYAESGTYEVTLTLAFDQECVAEFSQTLNAQANVPTAAFAATIGDCSDGQGTISFTNQTDNPTEEDVTYQWTFTGATPATSTELNPTVTVTESGTVTATLTVSAGEGCSTNASQSFTVELNNLNLTDAAICSGEEAELNPGGDGDGRSYTWSPSPDFDANDASPTTSVPGTYSVTVTSEGADLSCETVQTVTVTVSESVILVVNGPDGPITGPDAPGGGGNPGEPGNGGGEVNLPTISLCNGDDASISVDLTVNDEDISVTYTDTDGNVLGNGGSLSLNAGGTDTVIVTAVNAAGCSTTERVVVIDSRVNVSIDAGADGLSFCAATDTSVTIVNNRPDDQLTYAWEANDVITGALDGPTVAISTPEEGSVDLIVSVSNQFGCDTTITVTVQNVPFTPNTFMDVVTPCFAEEFTIVGGPAVEGYIYEFDSPEALDLTDPANPTGIFTADTVVGVTITDPTTGCVSEQTISVDVADPIDFAVSPGDTSLCEPGMVSVTGSTPNSNVVVTWFRDPELTDVITEDSTVTVDAEVGFTIYAQAVDSTTGCEQVIPVSITVSTLATEVSFADVNACAGDDAPGIFTPGSVNTNYVYTYEPAASVDTSDANNPVFVGTESQDLTVTVLDPATGCSITETIPATFNDLATLEGVADPADIFLGDESVLSINGCEGDSCEYAWTVPNGTISSTEDQTVTVMPDEAGTFTYTADVTSNGCMQSVDIELRVEDPICDVDRVFVPNAFTPNGDNSNDVMRVRSNFADAISEFRFIIYDRWGQEVYNSEDIDEVWDGTRSGDDLEPDVYGFWLRTVCPSGEELIQQGNITLLR